MDLKHLKTFICVAEAGSLSRASDRLRIAQPALSRHIKLLEEDIGVELFVRHVRGMDLTEPGNELLTRVSGIVRQLEQSVRDVQSMRDEIKGNVAIGIMPTVTSVFAVRLIDRVARDLPLVTLKLVEGISGHLVEWLQRGDIDLSFLYGPAADFHLRSMDLIYESVVLISPKGSVPTDESEIDFAAIADLDLALASRPHGLRVLIDNAAERAGIKLKAAFESDSYRVLKSVVANGRYHAFLPLSATSDDLAAGAVHVRKIVNPAINRQLILAMPSDRTNTRATDAVSELVRAEMAAMLVSGEWPAIKGSDLY